MDSSIKKSKALKLALIATPLILLAFLAILLMQQQRLLELQNQHAQTKTQLQQLSQERDFYRTQYETTVEDVNALARIHGETSRYAQLAQDLREEELQELIKATINKTHYLRNNHLWLEYAANGIISLSCLQSPQTIDTISDIVLVDLNTTQANYSIYIDGNYVTTFSWHGSFSVALPKGMHEIGIASKGPLTVNDVTFDGIPLNTSKATIDYGEAWEVFDCEDAVQGNNLQRSGTLRILFEKK